MQKASEKSVFFWLCALALLHAALTLTLAIARLYSFKASLLDSGTFDQVLWNYLQLGAPISTTNPPFNDQHWLGFHFSPLLALLLPLYSLWPQPEMLQWVQSASLAFAAIPLFYAVRALGASGREASVCAALFWLNPFVLSAAIWDFHEIAFSTLLMALAFWALSTKRFAAMLLALACLLLTKEHYGIAVAGFGFLWGWHHRDWKRGGVLMATGLFAAWIVLTQIMPHFRGGTHAMFDNSSGHLGRYGWLSAPWDEKIATLHMLLIGDASQVTGVLYLTMLLISGLFFPLVAPFYLAPAAADMLANLLSANPMPRHLAAYHSAASIPVIIIAGWQGYRWLKVRLPSSRLVLNATALIMMAVFPLTGLTVYPVRLWELMPLKLTFDTRPIREIQSIVGDNPIVTQSNVGMFFSQRKAIYPAPDNLGKTDFTVLHLFQPFADPGQAHFGIPFGTDTDSYVESVSQFLAGGEWHIAYWQKPWLVMQRRKAQADETGQRAEIAQALQDMLKPIARQAPQNP